MYRGVYILCENLEHLTAKFYYENEGRKSAEGSDIQIYYIQPITPVM